MRLFAKEVPRVLDWPIGVGGVYLFAWMLPGAWVGAMSEAMLGGVPEGWFFCFPDLRPAFLSGLALVILLPFMRPPRLRPIPYAVYGVTLPLVVTLTWLAWMDPPLFHNGDLRWWVSNQIPAMLVASSLSVAAAFAQIRLEARGPRE